jgi:hypothetical protein
MWGLLWIEVRPKRPDQRGRNDYKEDREYAEPEPKAAGVCVDARWDKRQNKEPGLGLCENPNSLLVWLREIHC